MPVVSVRAAIVEDDTGVVSHLPILFTEQGEIRSVTEYLLEREANGDSHSSIVGIVQSISLIIEYLEANQGLFHDPKILFRTFTRRLYSGTIGEDGFDPSGLYWIPTSTQNVNKHIGRLTAFTTWLADKQGTESMNPLREATPHEQRLNYAAWHRRNQNDFLGHISDKSKNRTIRKAQTIKGRQPLSKVNDDAIAFPSARWDKFWFSGLGGAKDPRVALRDQLIALLMHGGGLRESEALLLWVTDVFEDPEDPSSAIVRIYNEIDGKAPNGWKSRNGTSTRQAYLKQEYSRIPRAKMSDTGKLGWKSRVVDHQDQYLRVQWFPRAYGRLFMALWRNYQKYRASVDCNHPYAFIAFGRKDRGRPYTINAFHKNYKAALNRIGVQPNKAEGFGPHGHRHNYGRRLCNTDVHPVIIMKCMHHSSLESQVVYTGKSQKQVSDALNQASLQLDHKNAHALLASDIQPQIADQLDQSSTPFTDRWEALTEHGFKDIDPQGYFSGKHPKLGRK
jgi:integrase